MQRSCVKKKCERVKNRVKKARCSEVKEGNRETE